MNKLLTCLVCILLGFKLISTVNAQTVNVVVNVVEAPFFSSGPAEVSSNSISQPVNPPDIVAFSAIGEDPISSNYYFIVCKSDAVNENINGAPSCPGGLWCVSDLVSNGLQAQCETNTNFSLPETNDWYGFVCSSTTGGCSDSSQGSGESGSPFYLNHRPDFTSVTNDSPKNPGESITWTVEAVDPDVVGGNDQFKFYACRTNNFENGSCGDGSWCVSGISTGTASCSYRIDDIANDGGFGAYIFVTDEHELESDSVLQGMDRNFEISNMTPGLVDVAINNSNDINLLSGAFTNIKVTGTVTDRNSCNSEEISLVSASVYRSSIGYENCDELTEADQNNCYPNVECKLVEGEVCQHAQDTSLRYECDVNMIYHSDPTDPGSVFQNDDWKATMYAVDDDNSATQREVAVGVNVNSLVSFAVGNEIGYGALSVGQVIDPVSRELVITSYSNVGMDALLFGEPLTNGEYEVPVEYQRYAADSVAYDDAEELSSLFKRFELDLSKPVNVSASKPIYWGIQVPTYLPAGDYSGANYLIGIKGDIEGW